MAGPIYKLYVGRPTEAWYQLSEEEQSSVTAPARDSLEKVGAKRVIGCNTGWCGDQWLFFGIEKFPDIEAVQKHAQALMEGDHRRYFEGLSMLGTEWEPS